MQDELTRESEPVAGARGNWHWPVRYDLTSGYLGITQYETDGAVKDRVLLSPDQVRALVAFVRRHGP